YGPAKERCNEGDDAVRTARCTVDGELVEASPAGIWSTGWHLAFEAPIPAWAVLSPIGRCRCSAWKERILGGCTLTEVMIGAALLGASAFVFLRAWRRRFAKLSAWRNRRIASPWRSGGQVVAAEPSKSQGKAI